VQLEINAALLLTTTRQEFLEQVSRGATPSKNEANIARLHTCLQEVITTLPEVLKMLYT
jgi:hypothetical protein